MRLIAFLGVLLLVLAPVLAQEDNLLIFPLTAEQNMDACTTASFSFEVTNVGTFPDVFVFHTDRFDPRISERVLRLDSGETKPISFTVAPPCHLYGVQEIHFIGESQTTGLQFFEAVQLDIAPTHIPLIAPQVEQVRITFDRSGVQIPIQNLGAEETIYELELEGEPWMDLAEDEIRVPSQEVKEVQLITNPHNVTVPEGEYPATLVARVKSTSVEYAKTFTFILNEPTLLDTLIIYWWILPLVLVLLLLMTALIKRVRRYLEDTKEERAARREMRRQEREERKAARAQRKEERRREREAQKAQKLKEREARQKEKEQHTQARIEERARLREQKAQERQEHKRARLMDFLTRIFLRELRREFKYKPEGSPRRWPVVIVILAVAAVVLAWKILVAYATAVGAGILAAIIVLGLLALLVQWRTQRAKQWLDEKDVQYCREEALRRLKMQYTLIRRDYLQCFYPHRKRRILWIVLTVAIAAATVATYVFRDALQVWAWQAAVMTGTVLTGMSIIIALALRSYRTRRVIEREYGELPANRYERIVTGQRFGLGELAFKLKTKAESVLLRVRMQQRNPVMVAPQGKVFRYFTVEHLGFDDKEVEKSTFRFTVRRSWLDRHNIPEDRVKLMRYNNGRWVQVQSCSALSSDERVVVFDASHTTLSTFAIVGTPEVPTEDIPAEKEAAQSEEPQVKDLMPEEPSFQWQWLLYAGIALIVLAVLSTPFFTEQPQTATDDIDAIGEEVEAIANTVAGIDDGIPPQTWEANTVHRLNLREYFIDPDNESLSYTHTELAHITITYENDTAVLTPETGWSGEEVVVFTADDGNASVDSNAVRLRVTEPAGAKAEDYGTYVLLALVFLVILLIASSLFRRGSEAMQK